MMFYKKGGFWMNKVFSINALSEFLDLHPETLRSLIRENKMRAFKLGRKWMIEESAVNEFLDDQKANEGRPLLVKTTNQKA
ncbi:MAG: Helix-turn-helix domain [Bacteroidetes bacterium]|nr:Helix-turn-helix domain [Bacteroidota bacterium]